MLNNLSRSQLIALAVFALAAANAIITFGIEGEKTLWYVLSGIAFVAFLVVVSGNDKKKNEE